MMVSNQKISFSRRLFSGGEPVSLRACNSLRGSRVWSSPRFSLRLGHRLCSGGGLGVRFQDLKQTEEATYEATGKLVDGKLGKPPVFVFW